MPGDSFCSFFFLYMYIQQLMQLLSLQICCERNAMLALRRAIFTHFRYQKEKQQKDDHAILVNESR